jgi:hypothetical protein
MSDEDFWQLVAKTFRGKNPLSAAHEQRDNAQVGKRTQRVLQPRTRSLKHDPLTCIAF